MQVTGLARLSVWISRAGSRIARLTVRFGLSAGQHRTAREAPTREEERLRLAVEATGLGIWEFDLRTRVMSCSSEYRSMFGIDAESQLSVRFLQSLMHPDDEVAIRNRILRAVRAKDPTPFEMSHRINRLTPEPSIRWVSFWVRLILDDRGRPRRLVGTVQDITDRKLVELERNASEERLDMALRAGRMVAWDRDVATGIVTRSRNADAIIGNRVEHASDFLARVHPDDRALASWVSGNLAEPSLDTVRFRYRHPDGSQRWLETSAVRTHDEGGRGRVVGITADITEKQLRETQLLHLANHDPLTGLHNRIAFNKHLDHVVKSYTDNEIIFLMLADIDSFKHVNDTLGHDAGDAVLRSMADRLRDAATSAGFVARLGGDEFALLHVGPSSIEAVKDFADDLTRRLSEPLTIEGRSVTPGASIGIAIYPTQDPDPSALVKNADLALYAAKHGGRQRAQLYGPELRLALDARTRLTEEITQALATDRIIPFYQPKIDLKTGVVVGFEALARWDHPDRGILTPQVFGAVFEDGRLASAVGRRMLDRVFRDLKDWIERDLPVGRIAINFSSFEFRTPDLAQSVLERLRVSGIDNRHFEVEVVETVLLDRNTDGVIKTLKHFHDQGVKISLDDFGTGYASLIHLKRFPVDEIKLDRSFIVEMESGKNLALIAGVIQLGKSLGLTTVAEGMETRDQAEMLRAAGCDVGQGRLFSRPMAARDVPSFLTQAGRSRKMESEAPYTSAA